MTDPLKEREQELADAQARLRQVAMEQRARQRPPVTRLDGGSGDWSQANPALVSSMDPRGSEALVYTQAPNGGAERVGIDEYINSPQRKPLDPSTLRQDWGDAGTKATGGGYPASNPDASRDFSLDGTVRHENGNYVARDAAGSDTNVPQDQLGTYFQDMDQGPAYEPGDADTKAFLVQRLREEADKNTDPRADELSKAVNSYGKGR